MDPYSPAGRRWLVAILVVAVAVRVAWVVYAARQPVAFGDPASYLYYGRRIAQGHGYRSYTAALERAARALGHPPHGPALPADDPPTAFFPPGYPFALGAVFWAVLHSPLPHDLPRTAAFFNVVCGVGTVLLVAEVGRHVVSARAGLVAAGLVAVWPNLVFFTATAHLETLFMLSVMLAVYVALAAEWREGRLGRRRCILLGIVLGLSVLVRPFSIVLVPALVIGSRSAGARWRQAAAQGALVVAVVAVVLTPWTVRNLVELGSPVVVSTNLGETLCVGHHVGASGHAEFSPRCMKRYRNLSIEGADLRRNRDGLRTAFRFARDHPWTEMRLTVVRAFYGYRNDHDGLESVQSNGADRFIPSSLERLLRWLADGYFYVVLGVALLGLPRFVSRTRPKRLVVLVAAVGLASVPLVIYGIERFHVPALPLLALLAAAPLSGRQPRTRRTHSPGGVRSAAT